MSEQPATTLTGGGREGASPGAAGETRAAHVAGGLIALYERAAEHHAKLSVLYSPPVGPRAAGVVENRHLARAVDERIADLQRQLGGLDPRATSGRHEVERALGYLRDARRRISCDWDAYKQDPSDPLSESVVQLTDEYEELLRCHRALVAEISDFAARLLEVIGTASRPLPAEGRTG
jgi:hypothetical protein